MKTFNLLIFLFLITFTFGQLPPFIKLCKRDSKINECLKGNIEIAKTFMKKGIPKLFLRPTNPFKITEGSVTTPIIKVQFNNFQCYGLENFNLENVNLDLNNNKFQIKLELEHVNISSNYRFDGKLVGIEVHGGGPMHGNISNLVLDVTLSGNRVEKNGKSFINFTDKSLKIEFDSVAYAFFNNLFENEELTRAANVIINENIRDFVYEFAPVIKETFVLVYSESITKLFEKFSIEELFPL